MQYGRIFRKKVKMKNNTKIVGIVLVISFLLVTGISMEVRYTINKYFKIYDSVGTLFDLL